jgi:two-component system chemotaxis response regulator CheY
MGKRILVVDDAAVMRFMISKIVTAGGYEVAGEAETGSEAVRKYKQLKPDLVTMDINMPESGLTALKTIREFDPTAKVIICSAMGQRTLISEALQAGALDFILKPFEDVQVLDAIRRILPLS